MRCVVYNYHATCFFLVTCIYSQHKMRYIFWFCVTHWTHSGLLHSGTTYWWYTEMCAHSGIYGYNVCISNCAITFRVLYIPVTESDWMSRALPFQNKLVFKMGLKTLWNCPKFGGFNWMLSRPFMHNTFCILCNHWIFFSTFDLKHWFNNMNTPISTPSAHALSNNGKRAYEPIFRTLFCYYHTRLDIKFVSTKSHTMKLVCHWFL